MAQGHVGLPKLHLVAHLQFWRFATGPDPSNRGLFFKAALSSPNIEKCDRSGSAWLRVPKVSQNCTWLHTFNIGDSRQVRNSRTEAFFSKLLCISRMSKHVTKADQHGSGSLRSPKTALGCTLSILAICDRSGPVKQRPFFQSCSAYPECRNM